MNEMENFSFNLYNLGEKGRDKNREGVAVELKLD